MKAFVHQWVVTLGADDHGEVCGVITAFDATTKDEILSFERSGSSSEVLEELVTVMDASMCTSLAISEAIIPEGQMPLH